MNKLFPLLFLMLLSSTMYSQVENPILKGDLGINVNAILNKVIFKKVNDEVTNPFPDQNSIFTIRHVVSPKVTIRLGLGYDQFSKRDSTFSTFSGLLIEKNEFRYWGVHFGIQKNVFEARKVKITLGLDWFFRHEFQERNRHDFFFGGGIALEEAEYMDFYKENNLGFGVPIGFQYYLTDRIFLSTEFSMELYQTFSKNKTEYNGSNDNDYWDNPDVLNFNIRPPLSLFVHYRF